MKDLSEEYYNPNIIYHYTSLQTLVNFILPEKQLKFKKRVEQDDYFERTYINPVWFLNSGQADSNSLSEIDAQTNSRFQNILQISFCKSGYYDNDNWERNKAYDGYGFLKHRMWDNYGNKNKGVCLAFDRRNIEEKLSELNVENFWFREVDYIKNEEIKQILKPRTSQKLTDSVIENALEDYLRDILFLKNIDFRDENEFRATVEISSSEEVFLQIETALKSVFISAMRKTFPISDKVMFDHVVKQSKVKGFEVYVLNPLRGNMLIYEAN